MSNGTRKKTKKKTKVIIAHRLHTFRSPKRQQKVKINKKTMPHTTLSDHLKRKLAIASMSPKVLKAGGQSLSVAQLLRQGGRLCVMPEAVTMKEVYVRERAIRLLRRRASFP